MKTRTLVTAGVALVAAAGLAVALNPGTTPAPAGSATSSIVVTTTPSPVPKIIAALDKIPIKGSGPKTGYSRDQFGAAWTDDNDAQLGHNGCDTRDDILGGSLRNIRKSGRCIVIAGTLDDPYTGRVIQFTRGTCTSGQTVGCSNNIQIDHVVALGDAWISGANRLTRAKRIELANDPNNLRAVDGPTNGAKGDSNAASWLPPNRATWCGYVATQTFVKAKYGLSMTQAEHDRIATILRGCP